MKSENPFACPHKCNPEICLATKFQYADSRCIECGIEYPNDGLNRTTETTEKVSNNMDNILAINNHNSLTNLKLLPPLVLAQ